MAHSVASFKLASQVNPNFYSHLRYPVALYTWPAPRRRLDRRFVGPMPML